MAIDERKGGRGGAGRQPITHPGGGARGSRAAAENPPKGGGGGEGQGVFG